MIAPRAVGRVFALGAALFLLVATAWACLIAGAVVLLAPWLGVGFALLTVAGVLLVLILLILVVAGGTRPRASPAERAIPAALAQGARSALSRPWAVRGVLVMVALLFGLAAVLMPGSNQRDDKNDG